MASVELHPCCNRAGLREPCIAGHGITDILRAARRRHAARFSSHDTPAPPSGTTAANSQEGLK
jgi:hypothetical protein